MAEMILRVRSRDGLERVTVDNPHTTTVWQLKALIQSQLGISIHQQILSTDHRLLLAKTAHDLTRFVDMAGPAEAATLASLGLISHGCFVFLLYPGQRTVAGPAWTPAGSFGLKMTVADLAAEHRDADLRRAKAKAKPEVRSPMPIPVSDDRSLHRLLQKLRINCSNG